MNLKKLWKKLFGKPEPTATSPIDVDVDAETGAININERRDSMPKAKFFLFEGDEDGQWYFHLKSSNGKIICQSEGYTRKENALNGIKAVKKCAASAKIEIEGE